MYRKNIKSSLLLFFFPQGKNDSRLNSDQCLAIALIVEREMLLKTSVLLSYKAGL